MQENTLAPVPISIPTEIYQYILQYVDSSSLSTLCTVSQMFRSECERALYSDIDLSRSYYAQVRAWSQRVGKCTRVSRTIRSLVLPETLSWSYSTSSQEIYEFRKSVSIALRATVNLTALTIRTSPTSCLSHTYLDLWMLEGCKFRLRKLHNEGDSLYFPGRTLDFFVQQTEVRDWMPGRLQVGQTKHDTSSPAHIPLTLFPNLTTIHFRDLELCASLPARGLKHVSIDTTRRGLTKSEAEELFAALGRAAGKTVIELRFVTEGSGCMPGGSSWWGPVDIIRLVGERLPRVRTVRYCGIISRLHRPELDSTELLSTLSQFKYLETFILYPLAELRSPHTSPDTSPERGLSSEISEDNCLQVAKMIMRACPTLRHVALPSMGRWSWECFSYRREEVGEVVFEGRVGMGESEEVWRRVLSGRGGFVGVRAL